MKIPFFWVTVLAASCSSHPPGASGETKNIHVEGHRGARAVFPENSLPAFEYALKSGVDVLELDMGVTADHHVIVSHEPYVNPELCTLKNGKEIKEKMFFKDLTLAQVKEIVCGLKPHPRFPQQHRMKTSIATLDEVFALVKQSSLPAAATVRFNIETKTHPGHPGDTWDVNTFVDDVLRVVKASGLQPRVVLQSFDFRTLRRFREVDPSLVLAALTEENVHPLKTLGDLKVEILSPNFNTLDEKIVRQAQRAGMKVVPWTVNQPQDWEKMIQLRVDGIISDDPAPLLAYLREKGFHP